MSDQTMKLFAAAAPHVWSVQDAVTPEDVDRCARNAIRAVLAVMVGKAFPDDDVDYGYACEELAMDACETARALGPLEP